MSPLQLNTAAEAVISQMAAQTKTVGGANSGLTVATGTPMKIDTTNDGSQIISTSANKIILSSSALGGINAPFKSQTMLSLPVDEPETLKLSQFDINSNICPISPVPDTTNKVAKQSTNIDDSKYFPEISEFYDSWNADPVDIDLFPELY